MNAIKTLAFCLLIPLSAGATSRPESEFRVLYETDSLYHHVRVTESPAGIRYLAFDRTRGSQSAAKPGDPAHLEFHYTQTTFVSLAFLEEDPKDVLIVGLGGGSMPMFLRHYYPQTVIDAVDIDPVVVEVAQKYFAFKPDEKMNVVTRDGRLYLRRSKKRYDIIILDAYNSLSIPFHLTTREFLQQVSDHLKPGGIVASNVGAPEINKFHQAEIKTYQSVFPELYLFKVAPTRNFIFVASARKGRVSGDELVKRAGKIMADKKLSIDLPKIIREQYNYGTDAKVQADVLTDDYAPVNLLRVENEK